MGKYIVENGSETEREVQTVNTRTVARDYIIIEANPNGMNILQAKSAQSSKVDGFWLELPVNDDESTLLPCIVSPHPY